MPKFDIIRSKILAGLELDRWLAYVKIQNVSMFFRNGCFDVLHRGHIEYLQKQQI